MRIFVTRTIIIKDNEFNHLVIGGDLNADFSRNTGFVHDMTDFIQNRGLCCSWDSFPINCTYVFESDNLTSSSSIDHFLWNSEMSNSIIDAGTIHNTDNSSKHLPIFCKIKTDVIQTIVTNEQPHYVNSRKLSWKKASYDQKLSYIMCPQDKINNIW